jgi:hypothetical protein
LGSARLALLDRHVAQSRSKDGRPSGRPMVRQKTGVFRRPITPRDDDSGDVSAVFSSRNERGLPRNRLENNVFITEKAGQNGAIPPGPGRLQEVSIEILYDPALGRAAKASLRLRLSPLLPPCSVPITGRIVPCYLAQPPHEQVIVITEIQYFHASNPSAARPAFPVRRGKQGEFRFCRSCRRRPARNQSSRLSIRCDGAGPRIRRVAAAPSG